MYKKKTSQLIFLVCNSLVLTNSTPLTILMFCNAVFVILKHSAVAFEYRGF